MYVKADTVKAGDKLVAHGFTCVEEGKTVTVMLDETTFEVDHSKPKIKETGPDGKEHLVPQGTPVDKPYSEQLYFKCAHGHHYLSGQEDENGDLVGLFTKDEAKLLTREQTAD